MATYGWIPGKHKDDVRAVSSTHHLRLADFPGNCEHALLITICSSGKQAAR
jgi:hypothetical protein